MKRLTRLVLSCLLALPAWAAKTELPMRLPDVASPRAYQLSIKLDPDQPRHSGEVLIELDIKRPSRTLRLNATGIAVQSALLEVAGQSAPLDGRARIRDGDLLDIDFKQDLPVGPAKLKVHFSGRLQDKDVAGLFRQKEGGDWYAFTQFEATDARMAFPCFDEPGWKVPWTLSLTVPAKLTAVANTPQRSETLLPGGWKRVDFQTSKPLPSYLVAFGVGPFDILDGGRSGDTAIRFITPRGRAAEARYAASMTPALVSRLESYFGMKYPYEKLDMMALPLTVGFGAMENAGLITFASKLMLAKPGEETDKFKRDYVAIGAHELAHQWFGNYVTMAWWDDLWLNESFASWMGDKITDQVVPEWHWQTSVQQARSKAMWLDRLHTTRRIHQNVLVRQDLGGAFDHITYQKGHAMLGMFETWLGAERFQAGVRRYMDRHAWGNATGGDFMAAMSDGDAQLVEAFRSFTEQPGIPRLALQLRCDGKPRLLLSQQRFLPRGSAASAAAMWQLPVTVRTPAGRAQLVLTQAGGELPLPGEQCPDWVDANVDGAGYYRPVYAPGQLLNLMSRADLGVNALLANLDDAKALTESGDLPLADALTLAERFASHSRREVVDSVRAVLLQVEPLLSDADRPAYAAWWQRLFGERAHRLGFIGAAGEGEEDRLLRNSLVAPFADHGRDAGLRHDADRLARAWLRDPGTLDAAVRASVLKTAALDGDRSLFDGYVRQALKTTSRSERSDLYRALGNFRQPQLAEAARMLLLRPEHDIRESEALLTTQNGNQALREGSLRFVMRNFKPLAARLSKEGPGRLPEMFSNFCSLAEADRVERFFSPLMARYQGGPNTLKQALETIRLCAAYREAQAEPLRAALKVH
ncbi:M1 family metallopeptidase [Chitinimonas arctica]|uniref:Aminopeptidase n=1 Tax=Chitinimonas arctica TaxID=2594795 RepID=A0A516SK99_9NEIS|nr:M1 family metallopeptidase [Chitinimonas arctica]QDQ28580.1 M1 family metallopeptidase [Chitinimonas arctica]